MYENRNLPLLSRRLFYRRVMNHGVAAFVLVSISLAIGLFIYHVLADLPWIDALLNASMILGGEGPVNTLISPAAKFAASLYALYSGLVLLVVAGILLAPVVHRIFHKFHLEKPGKHKGDA